MARLADISRGPGEYSLAKLSESYGDLMAKLKLAFKRKAGMADYDERDREYASLLKTPMNKLFSFRKQLKSGEYSKATYMPSTEELHTTPEYVEKWIK